MSFRIPLTRPWLPPEVRDDVERVLASGFLTEGPETEALEQEVARFLGVAHAVAVTSATTGLELALWALEIGPGDDVLVPDFTYPATASAVARVGARPVLVDVDPGTSNVTAELLEKAVTPRTRALVPVSIFGNPVDADSIGALARGLGIPVVEDAACSFGASFGGRRVGGLADLTVFSLHPRKLLTSGEGGLVCTDRSELAERVRSLKRFGLEDGRFVRMGTNAKLSNLQAAVARSQLRHFDEVATRRRAQVATYLDALADTPADLPRTTEGGEHAWQSFVVGIDDRDPVRERMRADGIEVQIGTYALHHEPAFQEPAVGGSGPFPGSDEAARRGLALPLFHDLAEEQQAEVIGRLRRELGA